MANNVRRYRSVGGHRGGLGQAALRKNGAFPRPARHCEPVTDVTGVAIRPLRAAERIPFFHAFLSKNGVMSTNFLHTPDRDLPTRVFHRAGEKRRKLLISAAAGAVENPVENVGNHYAAEIFGKIL